jgi:DNA replication protein DnaC
MPETCQYPGCENRDTYPLIDPNTNKKYHLCETHHEEAQEKTSSRSVPDEELDGRIEKLFGEKFRDCTFDSYRINREDFTAVKDIIQPKLNSIGGKKGEEFTIDDHLGQLRAARDGLEKFSEKMAKKGRGTVVLGGTEGVGKTHLAAACVRRLIAAGHEPAVWHGTHLLTQIRATYGNSPAEEVESVNNLISQMAEPDVLVLEDLRDSCFAKDMKDYVFSVVDEVYRNQSMLIITSNYTLGELANASRLGPHLADRLADPPSFVQDMEGVSFRSVRSAYQKKQQ